ncbi:Zinc finger C3HC4 RING-type [Arabidopsis suecica]|uniref:Zinc finger C3HC4 RING-type n=1 Tax=Arabidopsis suecica TaxID=45249 RepID=A0A8T2BB80_ARASU|nr:Zinc finger C3HC4 RING-type [Arabidopsis suecica]
MKITGMDKGGCDRCLSKSSPLPMDKGGCDKCLSESSPLAITTCGHKFCVKCILYLWTRKQKVTEHCICPVDGVKMTWLRPCILPEPEEIRSIVSLYNRFFRPKKTPDVGQSQLVGFMAGLFKVHIALLLIGTYAYAIHHS